MKLNTKSKQLINNIKKKNLLVDKDPITKQTNNILEEIYDNLSDAFKFIKTVTNNDVSLSIKNIHNFRNIPKPETFPMSSIPSSIREHIELSSKSSFIYKINIFERNITIIFITELTNPNMHVKTYNKYFNYLLVWLYIVNEYGSEKCVSDLKIFIYHTSLLKELPTDTHIVLDETNVNTAFTRTCAVKSEIIIFRKEEWFKVFIHETMHTFGLDFSDLDQTSCNKYILTKFKVNSEVRLYEAYTEFWARIINTCFVSYVNSTSFKTFLQTFTQLINYEVSYSCMQMIKILKYMKLDFVSLIHSKDIQKNYKEGSSILSYYIITFLLIHSWQDTLKWCDDNNTELINFKKTAANMRSFCHYIGAIYTSPKLIDDIIFCEHKWYQNNDKSLRMTALEIL